MGSTQSIQRVEIEGPVSETRKFFCVFDSYTVISNSRLRTHVIYRIKIRYQRFSWYINKRFKEFFELDNILRTLRPDLLSSLPKPKKFNQLLTSHSSPEFCSQRGYYLGTYLQYILDAFGDDVINVKVLVIFMEIGSTSFATEMGRKGREGYLSKSSGGYHAKFSRSFGDYFKVWAKRYVVVKDCCITYYKKREDLVPQGALHIDDGLKIWVVGRLIHIHTLTRVLILMADTKLAALEWQRDLQDFYLTCSRRVLHRHLSSYPPRNETPCRVFTCGRDYFGAVVVALLSAQHEILIASWMVSPYLWLTRPPEPPLRLDQVLKFKAEQGVKIYVMLYQEVELASQGNDSTKCKAILEALHPGNIQVVRHPNKLVGGSTAILWSHHEKVVVIDRRYAFVGGIDLAHGRYDDPDHILTDEEGWRFPGNDYYQPGEDHFMPIRKPQATKWRSSTAMADYEAIVEATDAELALTPVDVTAVQDGEEDNALGSRMRRSEEEEDGVADPTLLQHNEPGMLPRRRTAKNTSPESVDVDDVSTDSSEVNKPLEDKEINSIQASMQVTTQQDQAKVAALPIARPVASTPPQDAVAQMPVAYGYAEPPAGVSGKEKAMQTEISQFPMVNSFLKSISEFSEAFTTPSKGPVPIAIQRRHGTTRDMFPRMPWHDIQVFVGGVVARDIVSHFIQRWNHHKLAKGYSNINVFLEGTDNPNFGICARCELPNISQFIVTCPRCGQDLGPRGKFIEPPKIPAVAQPVVSPFILFECQINAFLPLPFSIQGVGPSVISGMLNNQGLKALQEGQLLYEHIGGVPDPVFDKICFDAVPPPFVFDRFHPSNRNKRFEINPAHPKQTVNVDGADLSMKSIPQSSPLSVGPSNALIQSNNLNEAAVPQAVFMTPNALPPLPIAQPVTISTMNSPIAASAVPVSAPSTAIITGSVLSVSPSRPSAQGSSISPHPATPTLMLNPTPAFDTTKPDPLPDIGDPIKEYEPSPEVLSGMSWTNPRAEELRAQYSTSKIPDVGDILISVNGIPVNHLDSTQIMRLLARIRFFKNVDCDNSPIKIVFKRFCFIDVSELESFDLRTRDYIKFIDEAFDVEGTMKEASMAPSQPLQLVGNLQRCVPPTLSELIRERAEAEAEAKRAKQQAAGAKPTDINDMTTMFTSLTMPSSLSSAQASVKGPEPSYSEPEETLSYGTADSGSKNDTTSPAPTKSNLIVSFICRRNFERKSLVCREVLDRETRHRMFEVSRHRDFFINRDVNGGLSKSCQVQVLRSVGMWSVGHRPEKSIYEAWIENISKAQRLVYIENQFFLSDTSGTGVQNRIAALLLEKLIAAAKAGRAFRVIVVIPLHPEGDFLNNASVRYVMHYQYLTICRGPKSLLRQFQDAVPNVRVSDYLQFFSLRNWGVIRGEVVTDQIYVHDKLLIVDDRVMVVGSANFNDRSMLGDRDTEMAVRIEDTNHVQSTMAGSPWVCGDLVRRTRETLMRRHLGDPIADVTDPLRLGLDDQLLSIATHNSQVYAVLDGMKSFDTCCTLSQFAQGLNASASSGPPPPSIASATARAASVTSRSSSRSDSLSSATDGPAITFRAGTNGFIDSIAQSPADSFNGQSNSKSIARAIPVIESRSLSNGAQSRGLFICDPDVEALTNSIRGQIVLYPLNFLNAESLGPSISTKAVLPTELFM